MQHGPGVWTMLQTPAACFLHSNSAREALWARGRDCGCPLALLPSILGKAVPFPRLPRNKEWPGDKSREGSASPSLLPFPAPSSVDMRPGAGAAIWSQVVAPILKVAKPQSVGGPGGGPADAAPSP